MSLSPMHWTALMHAWRYRKEHTPSIFAYADTIPAAIAAGEFLLDHEAFWDTLMSSAATIACSMGSRHQ
jgi:hypothetical protein